MSMQQIGKKGATFVNNYGLRKVFNPYATKNPTEALHPSERLKLSNRFSLINPKKNVLHVTEGDDDENEHEELIESRSMLADDSINDVVTQ